jgi:hypothetical protein
MKSQEITRRQEPIGEENADTARERKMEQGSIAHSFKQPPAALLYQTRNRN